MTHPPTWFDWITVAAIVLGPILALFAQRALDNLREKHKQRVQIYLTLMSLRSVPMQPDHVRALNLLDTIFDGGGDRDKKVREAWDRVLAHVFTRREGDAQALANWDNTLMDRRVDLYQAVGKAVGYDHSIDYIKTHTYAPQYHMDAEMDQIRIREGFANILTANGLKVVVTEQQAAPPPVPAMRPYGVPRPPR